MSLQTASRIFEGLVLTVEDRRSDYGEVRQISLGSVESFPILVVVHTERTGRTRIIFPPARRTAWRGPVMPKRYDRELSPDELAAMPDEDINYDDIPTLDEEFWKNAKIVEPRGKQQLTIRFDSDVIDYFKATGRGYQSRMNAVLRAYVDAHRQR